MHQLVSLERAYAMFDRAGLLPPPPPALVEAGHIMVDYISTVAKALRQAGVESTRASPELAVIRITASRFRS